ERHAPSAGEEQPSIAEPVGMPGDRADAIVAGFSEAYRSAGQPRMAVYFNRELSDEVREWIPGTQRQLDVRASASYEAHGPLSGPVGGAATRGPQACPTSRFYSPPTGRRSDPAEVWMWQFEDAVTAQLLEAGTILVDRAVIFRQMARLEPETAGMDGTV